MLKLCAMKGMFFFLHHSRTLSCDNANHRAGSQLKLGIKMFRDYLTKIGELVRNASISCGFVTFFIFFLEKNGLLTKKTDFFY